MSDLCTLKPASSVKSELPENIKAIEEQAIAYAINTSYAHHILWNHNISAELKLKLEGLGYTISATSKSPDNQPWPYIIGGF